MRMQVLSFSSTLLHSADHQQRPDRVTRSAHARAACSRRRRGSTARVTAGPQSSRAKQNLQLPEDSPQARELGEMILGALQRSALFMSAALPLKIFPPLFNQYAGGHSFGSHVDNAIRQVPGHAASSADRSLGDALLRRSRRLRGRRARRRGHLRRAQREAAGRAHGALPIDEPAPRQAGDERRAGLRRSSGFRA